MTPFILSLVISFVGYHFKILRKSWCNFMTPFIEKLQLVIKKYLCQCHNSFPGIVYNSNKEVLIGMSRYNYSQNHLNFILKCLFIFY